MRRLWGRVLEPEILDEAPEGDAQANLRDIARINGLTGARRTLLGMLRGRFDAGQPLRVLDAGAASGDFAQAIAEDFAEAWTVCLDLQHRNLKCASGARVQSDAYRLPFANGTFDVVHCSLLLHHFPEELCAELIAELQRVSRGVVLIQDLHRHWLAYYFLPATQWLLGWHPITVSDGMKSVAAGWRRAELEKLLSRMDLLDSSQIRWHFPSFRFFIAIDSMD